MYKYNSIHGGVIVPRGTSIVGMDLRKTKIRPKYVPDPTDPNQESSGPYSVLLVYVTSGSLVSLMDLVEYTKII